MRTSSFFFSAKIVSYLLCCISLVVCKQLPQKYTEDDDDSKLFNTGGSEIIKLGDLYRFQNLSNPLAFDGRITNIKGRCRSDDDCDSYTEQCFERLCICKDYYQRNEKGKCVSCPGLGAPCESCCNHVALACDTSSQVCVCIDEMCHGTTQGVFVTASQIALSAALIMGFAALAMVIYRLCTKPRHLSQRQRTAERSAENVSWGQTSFLRASLSSIQIRVLSRLRDRPPAYDPQSRSSRNAPQTDTTQIPDAPPPYEQRRESNSHQPPQYSEIILSPGEYVNNAFVDTETNSHPIRLNVDSELKT